MNTIARWLILCVAIVALLWASRSNAGVVNNVLTQWRGVAEKCDDPRQRDYQAMVNVAMFEAINAVTPKYSPYTKAITAPTGSASDAAAARAAHGVLQLVCDGQKALFSAALKTSLEAVADKTSRDNGEQVGAAAAAAVIAARANAKAEGKDPVKAALTAGRYEQTARLGGVIFAKQTPWIMTTPDETRPAAPPSLSSEAWARDFNEVKRIGAKKSTERTAEQTEIGKFWAPRSVRIVINQLIGRSNSALARSLVDDARFLARAEMAWADSFVAMMDAKYHYAFWRPITAIRHAEMDGNAATTPNLQWEPLVETPNHPEYTCGHCASAAAVGTVIEQEFGKHATPIVLELEGSALRRYDTPQEYIDEVSISRIYAGVHYRFSMDAGRQSGVDIGKLAVQRYFKLR